MSDKQKLEIESVMGLPQAIAYLEDLLASLKGGRLRVSSGGESVTLTPGQVVDFELTLSRKKDKEKFEVEMSWKRDKAGDDVTISADGPVMEIE
ncbi:amphi-Trp domain-containing protein [Desulfohalovibrio reitneri]|uniref:amphi-Trp domain-containing protein n=1 Tax=Desulfohalovibrio reitneri TaxID=1307759 RepID=UPI0004A6EE65|nr:amphi-Trp domain-containing protein [Desulfohalovibrio reitneri]